MHYLYQVNCVWVIGVGGGVGIGGGSVGGGRTASVARDALQPRFGRMPKPQSDYLSVPDVRRKCYKIPPENELCLCEDIFQQHQAKLVNCDVEDAIAVETYKEPSFDSNENVCHGHNSDCSSKCCCGNDEESSSKSSETSRSAEDRKSVSSLESVTVGKTAAAAAAGPLQLLAVPQPPSDKLTAEERDRVLQELDDILTGNFLTKIRRFSHDVQSLSGDSGDELGRRHSSLSTASVTAGRGRLCKRSSSLDTDEIVNYGRVSELTRRFSRLGQAGIIAPSHYCSEPNFRHKLQTTTDYDGATTTSSSSEYEVHPIRMVFIRPMSVSDDHLNKGHGGNSGGGVVLTEVTSDGENELAVANNAAQKRRMSFARKNLAFDGSLSSADGGGGNADDDDGHADGGDSAAATAADRYRRLKGGWHSVVNPGRAVVNYSKSSDTVAVSNLGLSHRRYSSVDVYDQVKKHLSLDVEKTEKEFWDGLIAEKSRRQDAIQEYLANKELLLMKMKSASVGGILRWNQEHQDTLLDDEEPLSPPPPRTPFVPSLPRQYQDVDVRSWSVADDDGDDYSDDDDDGPPPKDGLRRVLRTGLKGRRIRRLRKLESRSSGLALTDFCWRVSKDEPPSRHGTGCSSAEPPDNHITL